MSARICLRSNRASQQLCFTFNDLLVERTLLIIRDLRLSREKLLNNCGNAVEDTQKFNDSTKMG